MTWGMAKFSSPGASRQMMAAVLIIPIYVPGNENPVFTLQYNYLKPEAPGW